VWTIRRFLDGTGECSGDHWIQLLHLIQEQNAMMG
jgi:hypothetical protein